MTATFRSKYDVVYDTLLDAIIRGELRPGERIVIDTMVDKLAVSHIPIREALRQLEADGFVTFAAHIGATVTEIGPDHIAEVFALLQTMEILSGRAACQKMSDADLDSMARRVDAMNAFLDDPNRWSVENKSLHQFISDCAGMPLVKKMSEKVLNHWDRLRRYYLEAVFAQRVHLAQAEHVEIVAAFRLRDPDQVEQAVQKHNQSALAAYQRFLNTPAQAAAPRPPSATQGMR